MESNTTAIRLENISKVYKIYERPLDRLKESLHPFHKRYSREFYALQDISLDIKKGDTIGFIGRNGAGKSTLLKIITGVVTPSSGTMTVNGRIASLLELGAGFNPDMTGIENIYMNGTIMGCSQQEMEARLDDIVAFADIGDFIYQPVKMYSSGMFARVAFAVNAFVEPDILIVDEALSVGDAFFQSKCIDKMKHMMDNGVTVLFVSHDMAAIRSLCQRGVFLSKGRIVFSGKAEEAAEKYFAEKVRSEQEVVPAKEKDKAKLQRKTRQVSDDSVFYADNHIFLQHASYQRTQNGKADFYNVQLLDEEGNELSLVQYGQRVCLRMTFFAHEDIPALGFAYHIRSANGVEVVYSDTHLDGKPLLSVQQNGKYILDWSFEVSLQAGTYNLAACMSMPQDLTIGKVDFCDFVPCAVQFSVVTEPDAHVYGYVHWPNEVQVKQYNEEDNSLKRVMDK